MFGLKLHWYQLKALSSWLRDNVDDFQNSSSLEILNSLFPSSQFIYIYRKDTLRQAISLSIAIQTKEWARVAGSGEVSSKAKNLRFNPAQIRGCRNKTEKSNRNWQAFFEANALDFYSIAYEDFVNSYEETVKEVYGFLGVEYSHGTITIPTEKQATSINDRWLFYYKTVPQPL
ncbi:MAG: sulfotransferase, partial [Gloeomargaritaceae cyanobacterium C42_A2020_066]|nr:sulfotransferase [Gloeomargaritaceae cyanobacterium C42_A2020_066]